MKTYPKTLILLLFVLLKTQIIFPQWVQTNGPYGGSINCFAVIGTNIFAITSSGLLYKSTNNGTNWTQVNIDLNNPVVWSLATSGTNIFIGTHYDGVFLSTNEGKNWTQVNNGLTNTQVFSLSVNDSSVFAATGGGLFRSMDYGLTWINLGFYLLPGNINSLAASGNNVYVGTEDGGVSHSTDNGATWKWIFDNAGLTGVIYIAAGGTNVFIETGNESLLSSNNGSTWIKANNVHAIAFNETYIFAGVGYSGISLSTDNGTTWTQINNGLNITSVNAITISGNNIFAAPHGDGVYLSDRKSVV